MSLKAELETWAAALKAYDEEDFNQALELFSVRCYCPPLVPRETLTAIDAAADRWLLKDPHEYGPHICHTRRPRRSGQALQWSHFSWPVSRCCVRSATPTPVPSDPDLTSGLVSFPTHIDISNAAYQTSCSAGLTWHWTISRRLSATCGETRRCEKSSLGPASSARNLTVLVAITNRSAWSLNSTQPRFCSTRDYALSTCRIWMRGSLSCRTRGGKRRPRSTMWSTKPWRTRDKDTQYSVSYVPVSLGLRSCRETNRFQPVGVLYRPSEKKLKNATQKDYMGKAVSDGSLRSSNIWATLTHLPAPHRVQWS